MISLLAHRRKTILALSILDLFFYSIYWSITHFRYVLSFCSPMVSSLFLFHSISLLFPTLVLPPLASACLFPLPSDCFSFLFPFSFFVSFRFFFGLRLFFTSRIWSLFIIPISSGLSLQSSKHFAVRKQEAPRKWILGFFAWLISLVFLFALVCCSSALLLLCVGLQFRSSGRGLWMRIPQHIHQIISEVSEYERRGETRIEAQEEFMQTKTIQESRATAKRLKSEETKAHQDHP